MTGPADEILARLRVIPNGHEQPPEDPPRTTWRPVDLADVLEGRYQPPQPTVGARDDGIGLFYPGRAHSVASESEAGKSWFALGAAATELTNDRGVIYLDFEDDEGGVVGRLLALGVHRDKIRNGFAYIRPEDTIAIPGSRDDLTEALDDMQPTLAVLDGVTEAMTMHGLETRDNGDVAKFGRLLPHWIAQRGPAVVNLDHVTKNTETRGRYALGGAHKLNGLNGAAYTLENRSAFGIGITGRSTIRIAKDRPGQLRRHSLPGSDGMHWFADLVLKSHDVQYAELSIAAPEDRSDQPFRPTHLMQKVCEALERAGKPIGAEDIQARVTGKNTAIRAAVACLVDEGYVEIANAPRGGRLHRLVRPFMDNE